MYKNKNRWSHGCYRKVVLSMSKDSSQVFSDSIESSFRCRLILVKLNISLIKTSKTFSSYPKYFLNGRQAAKYLLIHRNKFNFNFLKDRSTISIVAISVIMVIIMKNNKMSKNVGRIIPGENFLGGNFPGGSSPGGNFLGGNFLGVSFPGDNFPDTICNNYLEYCPWLTLYHLVGAENKLRDLHKLDLANFNNSFLIKKRLSMKAALYEYNNTFPEFKSANLFILR